MSLTKEKFGTLDTKDPNFDFVVQGAVVYLVDKITKQSVNPKPVIWHSLRVAVGVYGEHVPLDVVTGAVLHDVAEDAGVSFVEIKDKFGETVAGIVESLTFNTAISDRAARYKDAYQRSVDWGTESVLIRAYDILVNSDYYVLAKDEQAYKFLLEKMKYFIDISKESIGDRDVWKSLSKRYEELLQNKFK